MVVAIGAGAGLVALLRDVHFAANDRVDSLGVGGVVELHGAEEIAVVGHGDGGHLLLDHDLHQLVDIAGSIEEGVIRVAMQMDEGHRYRTFLGRCPSILARPAVHDLR